MDRIEFMNLPAESGAQQEQLYSLFTLNLNFDSEILSTHYHTLDFAYDEMVKSIKNLGLSTAENNKRFNVIKQNHRKEKSYNLQSLSFDLEFSITLGRPRKLILSFR